MCSIEYLPRMATIPGKIFLGNVILVQSPGKLLEKLIGIIIDEKLSWKYHVKHTIKNLSIKIKKLYQMRTLSTKSLSTIYLQGILPSSIDMGKLLKRIPRANGQSTQEGCQIRL